MARSSTDVQSHLPSVPFHPHAPADSAAASSIPLLSDPLDSLAPSPPAILAIGDVSTTAASPPAAPQPLSLPLHDPLTTPIDDDDFDSDAAAPSAIPPRAHADTGSAMTFHQLSETSDVAARAVTDIPPSTFPTSAEIHAFQQNHMDIPHYHRTAAQIEFPRPHIKAFTPRTLLTFVVWQQQ